MSGFFGVVHAEELRHPGSDSIRVKGPGNRGCFALMCTGPAGPFGRPPVRTDERFLLWGDVRLDAREELRRQLRESDPEFHPASVE